MSEGQAFYNLEPTTEGLLKIVFRRENRGRPGREIELPPLVYDGPLGLAPAKYADLMNLCDRGVIPQDNIHEYSAMFPNRTVRDALNEIDEEDNANYGFSNLE